MAIFMLEKVPYQELCQNKKERKKNKERKMILQIWILHFQRICDCHLHFCNFLHI